MAAIAATATAAMVTIATAYSTAALYHMVLTPLLVGVGAIVQALVTPVQPLFEKTSLHQGRAGAWHSGSHRCGATPQM